MRALVLVLLVAAGCGARAGAFVCFSDEECMLAGALGGRCEQTGFCSFSDPACATGQRYGDYAGDNLGGRCVPAPGDAIDAGSEPDAAPLPACGSVGDECCADDRCEGTLSCTGGTCGCLQVGKPQSGAYSHHSCVVQSDGSGWCWGSDAQGQIGAGSNGGTHKKPVSVAELSGITMIAPGGSHTCAIASGEVWCWGDNEAGQLGSNGNDQTTPKKTSLAAATWIDSGGATTCAVSAGDAYCWGRNQLGQVGDGTDDDRNKPKLVSNLTGVVSVSSGVNMSCAVKSDATAWCWGAGDEGQLGNGLGASSLVPVQVTLTDVAEIAAGDDHVCARTSSGLVYCWGDNEFGAIGDGTRDRRLLPTQVMGLSGIAELDVADEFTCARKDDGTVWCWGLNDVGQLGLRVTSPFEASPRQVVGLTDATSITTGADHACSRRAIGALACWGANIDGQLGDDTNVTDLSPSIVRLTCP